jgi:hypothetical protein
MRTIERIIQFIIAQEQETIDDYPSLAKPIAEKFGLGLGVAEGIIMSVMEWETSATTIDSLEEHLNKKFPTYAFVTK